MTKIEKKRISILGCGWLGFPLAQRLAGLNILNKPKGSTTTENKISLFERAGIEAYLFGLTPGFNCDPETVASFLDADTLIISIPPKLAKTGQDFHVQQIESVFRAVQQSEIKDVIYISSTSVYPELNRVVKETDVSTPQQSAAPAMVTAEILLMKLRPQKTVSILRLGGLLGYERIPGKYVKGQKDMTTGIIPVNYIHRDDAVGIIATVLETGVVDETFNIVSPFHPTRSEVYVRSCEQFGWETPTFDPLATSPDFKIISGEKFSDFYSYEFKYPNPIDFRYEITE